MRKIVCLICAIAIIGSCTKDKETANAGIHGSVVVNGEPVNAAAILLTPGGRTVITGSDGMYNFSNLQSGRYELKVYKEGFQSFNKSIELAADKNEELVITLTANTGKLSLNKAYIDMGSNEGNNAAGFSIMNGGDSELTWSITNAAGWITQIDPLSGSVGASSSEAVVFTIDRSKLSANSDDNYATLVVRSTTPGDGSTAELLVTVFGRGDGTNINISDKDYIIIGDLYVQTKDIGGVMGWRAADNSCKSSTVGGYNDWRLPDIGELGLLYSKKDVIGNFTSDIDYYSAYWSNDGSPYYDYYSSYIDFQTGRQGSAMYSDTVVNNNSSNFDYWKCRCRAVRKASPLPVVSTLAVTNITANTATLNGKIDKNSDPPYTERGFVYSKAFQNPTIEDDDNSTTKRPVSGSSVEFSANISGLTTEQTYYVRAYATNSNGTVYGASLSFKPTTAKDYIVLQSEGIMVQKYDLSSGADWNTANSFCTNSRVGGYSDWRLPTIGELQALYNKRSEIGGFSTTITGSYYWSGTETYSGAVYYIDFYDGYRSWTSESSIYRVRAVRSLP